MFPESYCHKYSKCLHCKEVNFRVRVITKNMKIFRTRAKHNAELFLQNICNAARFTKITIKSKY